MATPRSRYAALAFGVVALALDVSCAPSASRSASPELARAAPSAAPAAFADEPWVSALGRDHPLVGHVWAASSGRDVTTRDELYAALRAADIVLLGEIHDNPDHHRLQARLLAEMGRTASGPRPVAVAFEMISEDMQAVVDQNREGARADVNNLGDALRWDKSGWPSFHAYAPLFQYALDRGYPIIAANLPSEKAKALAMGTPGEAPAKSAVSEVDGAKGETELPDKLAQSLKAELRESHCGKLPETHMDGMMRAQIARDRTMAERVSVAATRGAVALICGSGHARTDRGVPRYLAKGGQKIVSIAFAEVDAAKPRAGDYAPGWFSGTLPFDFVVFTPATKREDPCEVFRRPKPVLAP